MKIRKSFMKSLEWNHDKNYTNRENAQKLQLNNQLNVHNDIKK